MEDCMIAYLFAVLYSLTAFVWAMFCVAMQAKVYPKSTVSKKILVALLNYIFCPFSITLAMINLDYLIIKKEK